MTHSILRNVPVRNEGGFAPPEVTTLLRVEGLTLLVAALVAFQFIGGNWWLFAALILAPDLSMFGLLAGQKKGAWIYNIVHTTTVPAVLGGIALFAGAAWFVPIAVIWIAHIGMDRAVGFGLKYPQLAHATHLGWIGTAKRSVAAPANAS